MTIQWQVSSTHANDEFDNNLGKTTGESLVCLVLPSRCDAFYIISWTLDCGQFAEAVTLSGTIQVNSLDK